MFNSFYSIVLIVLALPTFAQVDTSFYSPGKIKDIRVLNKGQIIRATVYKLDGQVKYSWSMEEKKLESFDALTYLDTLSEYFREHCRDYTLRQHYGNGPLMEIENYKDNKRDGPFEQFDISGRRISKGQFSVWKKVGIWTYYDDKGNRDRHIHWFHHNYYEGGISIDYLVIPIILTLVLIGVSIFLILKYSRFSSFYYYYSVFTITIFVILFSMGFWLSDSAKTLVARSIGNYFFPVLSTLSGIMVAASLAALTTRRAGVKTVWAFLFLLIGLGFCYLLFVSYIYSQLSGVMLG